MPENDSSRICGSRTPSSSPLAASADGPAASDPLISPAAARPSRRVSRHTPSQQQKQYQVVESPESSKTVILQSTASVSAAAEQQQQTPAPPSYSLKSSLTLSLAKILLVVMTQIPLRVAAYPIAGIVGLAGRDSAASFLATRDSQAASSKPLDPQDYWIDMAISCTLVLLGGVFAGLTLGLMGQDEIYLQVIQQSGEPAEKKAAGKVLSLLNKGKHWVLVTLLLSNVITNESLPIVLDRVLGGGWPAIVSSTVAIVIFGEIIPQSVSVRYGLSVGAWFAPFVLALMYIMYPVAYPVAMLLDWILGEDHGTIYKRAGLKTLVGLHKTMGVERLNDDEVTIISAVLDLKDKPVALIMTPMENVFTMSADTHLDEPTVEEILRSGFNRIPIHAPDEPTNFIGMLLVRTLITYDPEDNFPISSFPLATLPETGPETSCLNILNYFQEGKSHMVVVSNTPGASTGALGVVTLEDVIEELIGEEIIDESDVYVDVHNAIKRSNPVPLSKVASMAFFRRSPRPSLMLEGEDVLKRRLNPLNRASNPKQTASANITIKRSNLESLTGGGLDGLGASGSSSSVGDSALGTSAKRPYSHGGYKPSNLSVTMTHEDSQEYLISPTTSSDKQQESQQRPQQQAQDLLTGNSQPNAAPEANYGTIYRTEQSAIEEALLLPKSPGNHSRKSSVSRRFSRNRRSPATAAAAVTGDDAEVSGANGITIKDSRAHDENDPLGGDGYGDIAYQDRLVPNVAPELHSYRTGGGIIESVIQIDGVNKTIIEDVANSVHNSFIHHAASISGPSGDNNGNGSHLNPGNNWSSNVPSSASSWRSRSSNDQPDQQPLLSSSPGGSFKD